MPEEESASLLLLHVESKLMFKLAFLEATSPIPPNLSFGALSSLCLGKFLLFFRLLNCCMSALSKSLDGKKLLADKKVVTVCLSLCYSSEIFFRRQIL